MLVVLIPGLSELLSEALGCGTFCDLRAVAGVVVGVLRV